MSKPLPPASSGADNGPEKTIDGSGLDATDQHSTEPKHMWLSAAGPKPAWIQYEFDRLYKLDRMLVWNSNQTIEAMFGFGAKNVKVEYSTDGTMWTALGDFVFAQATGAPTYAGDTPVDFAGAVAKYVKLTINSNWGGLVQAVRPERSPLPPVPMRARQPEPATGATGVAPRRP